MSDSVANPPAPRFGLGGAPHPAEGSYCKLRAGCVTTLRVGTLLLAQAAHHGLSFAQLADFMCEPATSEEEAELLAAERPPKHMLAPSQQQQQQSGGGGTGGATSVKFGGLGWGAPSAAPPRSPRRALPLCEMTPAAAADAADAADAAAEEAPQSPAGMAAEEEGKRQAFIARMRRDRSYLAIAPEDDEEVEEEEAAATAADADATDDGADGKPGRYFYHGDGTLDDLSPVTVIAPQVASGQSSASSSASSSLSSSVSFTAAVDEAAAAAAQKDGASAAGGALAAAAAAAGSRTEAARPPPPVRVVGLSPTDSPPSSPSYRSSLCGGGRVHAHRLVLPPATAQADGAGGRGARRGANVAPAAPWARAPPALTIATDAAQQHAFRRRRARASGVGRGAAAAATPLSPSFTTSPPFLRRSRR